MAENRLEVIAPDGWKKEYVLHKPVVFIGSDPGNDIALAAADDPTIAPRHLQLIADPSEGFRLVNLGDSEVWLGPAAEKGVPPHGSTPLTGGEPIKIGRFIITLRGEMWVAGGGPTNQSRNLGLNLALPQTRLAPNETLEGVLTVFNLGNYPGAQFELGLTGFDPDCYEIEPGPLLSAGADKEMSFWLYHRGQQPPAGETKLTIWAAAPKAYPRERVTATRTITVLPFYQYTMRLFRPGEPEPKEATRPVKPVPVAAAARSDRPQEPSLSPGRSPARPKPAEPAPPEGENADWWQPLPAAAVQPAEPARPEIEIMPEEPETGPAEAVEPEAAADTGVSVSPSPQPSIESSPAPEEVPPSAAPAGEEAVPPAPPVDTAGEETAPPPAPAPAQPVAAEIPELEPPESPPALARDEGAGQPPEDEAAETALPAEAAAQARPRKQPPQHRQELSTGPRRPTPRPGGQSADLWAEASAAEPAESQSPGELWAGVKQEPEPLKVRAKKYKPSPAKATKPETEPAEEEPAAGAAATADSDDWWNDEL